MVITPLKISATETPPNDTDNYTVVKEYTILDNFKEVSFYDNSLRPEFDNNANQSDSVSIGRKPYYVETRYSVTNAAMVKSDAKAKDHEIFLISIPEGYTKKLSTSKTITGSLSATGSISTGEKSVISKNLSLSASGTISKTYTTEEQFTYPKSYKGKYNTANYYTAVAYDYYRINMSSYELWNKGSGMMNALYKKNEKSYTVYVYVPKIVMYTQGVNYTNNK